jgi:hypothetical protein
MIGNDVSVPVMVRQATQYYLDGPLGLGGYHLNIYLVYVTVSLTCH